MTLEDLLQRDGRLVYKTRGVSMEPMLRQNRDLVIIQVPASRLKKYDVALYKRGKAYILHRVIEVKGDYYFIRGDNTFFPERVSDDDVIGVLSAFQRKGKQYKVTDRGYLIYARVWCAIYPLRRCCYQLRCFAVGVVRGLGIMPVMKKIRERKEK